MSSSPSSGTSIENMNSFRVTFNFLFKKTLEGFTLRCTTKFFCNSERARHNCLAMFYSSHRWRITLGEGEGFGSQFQDFIEGVALFIAVDDVEFAGGFEHAVASDDVIVLDAFEYFGCGDGEWYLS